MKKVAILSIDGGGIRGIIPAVILNYIEKRLQALTENPEAILADYFDLIAGTSTGGILTCYYLHPKRYSATEAVDMYVKYGKDIFNRKLLRYGVAREKYPATGLEKVLKNCLGDTKLSETTRNCMITAYDVTERKAVFFTTPEAKKYEHRDYFLRDVARSTSAAPTYFELSAIKSMGGASSYLIDGAMYAGNPTMCAVVEANKTVFETCANPAINDLYIVSLGTGTEKKMYDYNKAKGWGAVGWAKPVLDILLSASAEVVDYQMRQLFSVAGCRDCYLRLEPDLGKAKPDMDDASVENISRLRDTAECFIKDHLEKLDHLVHRLIEIKRE